MSVSPKPTSILLVGALFISLFLGPGLAEPYSDSSYEQNKLKEISSSLIPPEKNTDLGQLKVDSDMIYYPWASRRVSDSASIYGSVSTNDEIRLNNSNPSASVPDLSAINSRNENDLIFRDSQNGDSKGLPQVNSLDISLTGNEYDSEYDWQKTMSEAEGYGQLADEVRGSRSLDDADVDPLSGYYDSKNAGNYLNVIVSGISVSALNTIEGGSAIATSNIIIEPVQVIICDPAVKDKLR